MLDYSDVFIPPGLCQESLEFELSTLPNALAVLRPGGCREAVASYFCSFAFRRCGDRALQLPCQSTTDVINSACTALERDLIIPNLGLDYTDAAPDAAMGDDKPTCNKGERPEHIIQTVQPMCQHDLTNLKTCAGVVDFPYYIPAGFNDDMLEAQVSPYA